MRLLIMLLVLFGLLLANMKNSVRHNAMAFDGQTNAELSNEPTDSAQVGPTLSIPDQVAAQPGAQVTLPVTFSPGESSISTLIFSIDYDQSLLRLDAADSDEDGTPDAVVFGVPPAYSTAAVLDAADADGELDVTIFDPAPPLAALSSRVVVSLTFTVLLNAVAGDANVAFSQNPAASFGSTGGQSVPGTTANGSVRITGPCYTLQTSVTPTNAGTLSLSVPANCEGSKYTAGTIVQVTASASTGYSFTNWGGDAIGSTNPISVTVDRNKNVEATFTSQVQSPNLYLPFGRKAGSRTHQNVSQQAGGAEAAGDPTGYVTPSTNSHHVYYRGSDNQIHELFWRSNEWVHNNLNQLAGGAPAAAGDPSAYVTPSTDEHHIYYRGADKNIYELVWINNSWVVNNLSLLAGNTPIAASDPTGYVTPSTGSHHVYYRGSDNQIHELFWNGNAWVHNNLSELAGNVPLAASDPTAYVTPSTGSHHVYYRGQDNQIYELLWRDNSWTVNNLSLLAGNAPTAAGDPSAYVTPSTDEHHIYYRGQDNQIYELLWRNDSWTVNNLSLLAGNTSTAAGDPTAYVTADGNRHYVYYRGTDGQLHQLYWNDSAWIHTNVSQLASTAPTIAGDSTGFIVPTTGSHYLYYRGTDNQIHELSLEVSFDGLVAYWSFDNGTVVDNSGSGLNGTVFGTLDAVDGAVGKALQFDRNDYIQVPDFSFANRSQLSVTAWVKPIAVENQALGLVSKHSSPADAEILLRVRKGWKI